MKHTKAVIVRLPAELVKEVDYVAVDDDVFRSQAVERLLRAGLKHIKECEHV